jgi:DNA modification methylase
MTLHYQDDRASIYHGDCIGVMRTLPDNSVDAVVTDPPYLLDFMGKGWDAADGIAGKPEVWREALRVLKPGGHLLAFGGTRTWHRLAVAIEDAGFEVRDSIAWMYGSGFPKSHDVSKGIDKRGGVVPWQAEFAQHLKDVKPKSVKVSDINAHVSNGSKSNFYGHFIDTTSQPLLPTIEQYKKLKELLPIDPRWDEMFLAPADREVIGSKKTGDPVAWYAQATRGLGVVDITAPATPAAQQWQGWGTALKPAHEPIVVARKPLIGTVAANVLTHGTGALNIDGCRIAGNVPSVPQPNISRENYTVGGSDGRNGEMSSAPAGRWPANVILDESQAAALDAQSGDVGGGFGIRGKGGSTYANGAGFANTLAETGQIVGHGDSGGASRFFYIAKASSSERPVEDGIAHPTVKPLRLMEYLCRLVTPPGGTILEPFAGSGTTIEAALNEGFNVIGIEMTDEYLPLIMERIERYGEKLW